MATCNQHNLDIAAIRRRFPALARTQNGQPVIFFDGPAGSQAPRSVVDSVADYLVRMNANHDGLFATSRESDAMLDDAHRAMADFVGTDDPDTVVFGANMTSLTFALSRALAKTWRPGDEVLLSRLDHDANFTPWVLAAKDAGATVRHVEINADDCTLDIDDLTAKLSPRTRLVAVGCAGNATGTINPVEEIVAAAHRFGALVFLDAVHYAPHALPDVAAWDCDFLACSAYKFFGPHVGVLWGRRQLMADLPAYKVRPAPDDTPGRWMTGTQNHEGIAGTLAAVEYLADLGRSCQADVTDRRAALVAAYRNIASHERSLVSTMLAGLAELPAVKIWGITDQNRLDQRVPTVAITHDRIRPAELARHLGDLGIFVWHGNFYAQPLTEALGLEPDGMVRIGLLHYNTQEEVQRFLGVMANQQPPRPSPLAV